MIDTVSVKIPPLHFGKKSRGKLVVGTEIFEGSFAELNKFVPNPMTRRQVVSKFSALFDMFGKLTPVSAPMKLSVRKGTKETGDLNDFVSAETRSVVVKNLWRLYKLQGVQFNRARIPPDAADTKLHLVCCVDAADQLKIAGVWARFRRVGGGFSSQLVIGRSLLGREDSTIPKEELEALTIGSNLLWICRRAMEGWLDDYSLCGDSVIALCWITSEKKRLSLFHRNRVMQTRFNTDLEKLFHVRSEFNPSDIGTRCEKVRDEDIGPHSVWENGMDWMKEDFDDALEADVLKYAKNLRMSEEEEHEYERGLVFERCPEILIRGHCAYLSDRVQNLADRANFSDYIFMPTKFNFRKVVRVTALLFKYLRNTKSGVWPTCGNKFRMFVAQQVEDTLIPQEEEAFDFFVKDDKFADICWGSKNNLMRSTGDVFADLNDDDISLALEYWYKKGTHEVKQFNKPELVSRIGVERNGILFSRSRILEGQRFIMTGEFGKDSLGKEVQLDLMTPVLDRFSPISYCKLYSP